MQREQKASKSPKMRLIAKLKNIWKTCVLINSIQRIER